MKQYLNMLSASVNRKGVLDIDTVKGCAMGMNRYPVGGCYGLCYAAKMSNLYGYDFSRCSSRYMSENTGQSSFDFAGGDVGSNEIYRLVKNHPLTWFRIGTMGDPSHNWPLTLSVCEWLARVRTPVIITKHWIEMTDQMLARFDKLKCVFNTSISALDTCDEIEYRLAQYERIYKAGCRSVLRIVSCKFGDTEEGNKLRCVQDRLFEHTPVIDTPLRIPKKDPRVLRGDIIITATRPQSISQFNPLTYTGKCEFCPDQCGAY